MIVRVAANLDVVFGRVDEDGDVVNQTKIAFPIGKFCAEEWERVYADVLAKHAQISAAFAPVPVEELPGVVEPGEQGEPAPVEPGEEEAEDAGD